MSKNKTKLDKNKLKKACDKLGLEIEFDSDKAGLELHDKDGKVHRYTWEELAKSTRDFFGK